MSALLQDETALAATIHTKKDDSDHIEKISEDELEHEPDDIHDGLEFPTEEERATLRRIPDTVPWNAYCEFLLLFLQLMFTDLQHCPVISVVELAERFSVGYIPVFSFNRPIKVLASSTAQTRSS